MLEPLYTAAEMRAAEERYPGYPADGAGADGAGRCGRRPRGAAALPQCAPGRGRLRRRCERRRRADRSEDSAGRGSRRRRDDCRRAGRRDRRCALRHRLPRRAACRRGGDDPADQCRSGTGRLRRRAFRCRRVDRRGSGRGGPGDGHRDVPRSQGRARGLTWTLSHRRGGRRRHRARALRDGLEAASRPTSSRSCRANGPRTTSTAPARCSSSGVLRA